MPRGPDDDTAEHPVYVTDMGVRAEVLEDKGERLRLWLLDGDGVVQVPRASCVGISEHGERRWRQRGGSGSEMGEAWCEAERIEVDDDRADEMRYHGPTNTVLVLKNGVVSTVLRVDKHTRSGIRGAIDELEA